MSRPSASAFTSRFRSARSSRMALAYYDTHSCATTGAIKMGLIPRVGAAVLWAKQNRQEALPPGKRQKTRATAGQADLRCRLADRSRRRGSVRPDITRKQMPSPLRADVAV